MDMGLVHMPLYTGMFAAVLMTLQIVLMGLVIGRRGNNNVLIGTGGVDAVERAVRAHGNLIENAPMLLICLALIELIGGSDIWVLALGSAFLVGRLMHAIGLSTSLGVTVWRFTGTVGSMITMLIAAGYLAYLVLGKM
jgi:uncharacterized membrane protein YecN with MAPEG domain